MSIEASDTKSESAFAISFFYDNTGTALSRSEVYAKSWGNQKIGRAVMTGPHSIEPSKYGRTESRGSGGLTRQCEHVAEGLP
jgi:hypothetical protein